MYWSTCWLFYDKGKSVLMDESVSIKLKDEYSDIRPYLDDEVADVIERLCADNYLLPKLVHFQVGSIPYVGKLIKVILKKYHQYNLMRITNVQEFQRWLTPLIESLLQRTSTQVSIDGLEALDPNKPYLWISSHRDIAMDPLMINYALYKANWQTSRIAIGDNLLLNTSVADVMRLNKSFIVPRSVTDRREKLKQYKRLSTYIYNCIDHQHSVWIAQREGRAKDNQDLTDKAVLKMLALFGREKNLDFQQSLSRLNPVPVYIQYEWDPCDLLKAKELVSRRENGDYEKTDKEDVISLVSGLLGSKGHIHVRFGSPLDFHELSSPEQMALSIDEQMQQMQQYSQLNQAALVLLQSQFGLYQSISSKISSSKASIQPYLKKLEKRISDQSENIKIQVLESYARPLLISHKI